MKRLLGCILLACSLRGVLSQDSSAHHDAFAPMDDPPRVTTLVKPAQTEEQPSQAAQIMMAAAGRATELQRGEDVKGSRTPWMIKETFFEVPPEDASTKSRSSQPSECDPSGKPLLQRIEEAPPHIGSTLVKLRTAFGFLIHHPWRATKVVAPWTGRLVVRTLRAIVYMLFTGSTYLLYSVLPPFVVLYHAAIWPFTTTYNVTMSLMPIWTVLLSALAIGSCLGLAAGAFSSERTALWIEKTTTPFVPDVIKKRTTLSPSKNDARASNRSSSRRFGQNGGARLEDITFNDVKGKQRDMGFATSEKLRYQPTERDQVVTDEWFDLGRAMERRSERVLGRMGVSRENSLGGLEADEDTDTPSFQKSLGSASSSSRASALSSSASSTSVRNGRGRKSVGFA